MEDVVISIFASAIVFFICYAIPKLRNNKKTMGILLFLAFAEVSIPVGGILGLVVFGVTGYFYEKQCAKQTLAGKKIKYTSENFIMDLIVFFVYFIMLLILYNTSYKGSFEDIIGVVLMECSILTLLIILYRYVRNHTPFAHLCSTPIIAESKTECSTPITAESKTEDIENATAVMLLFLDECLRAPLTDKEKYRISGDLFLIQSLMKNPDTQKEFDTYLVTKFPNRVRSLNNIIFDLNASDNIDPTEDELDALRYAYLYNHNYSLYVVNEDLQGLAKNTLLAAHHRSAETRKVAYEELMKILTRNNIFDRSVAEVLKNIKDKEAFYIEKFKNYSDSDPAILEAFKGVLPPLCYSDNIKFNYLSDAFIEALKRLDIDIDTYEASDPDVVEF